MHNSTPKSGILQPNYCKPWLAMKFRAACARSRTRSRASNVQQLVISLVYGNLPTKSLHVVSHILFAHRRIPYLLVPLCEDVSQRYCLHIILVKIAVTFRASRFVDSF